MRGFATNVAGNRGTEKEQAWVEQLVARLTELGLPNKHYVIDTSRNGVDHPPATSPAPWSSCNNFNAAAGTRSTTKTTGAHADAYLWIHGIAGFDGDCGNGGPPAGEWYPKYAESLIRNGLKVGSISMLEPPPEF